MSNFINYIEEHKYGIFAAVLVNVGIFIYLQIPQIDFEYEISPYLLDAALEIPDDPESLELNPDFEIIRQQQSFQDVKNASRDMNDTRPQSDKDYSSTKSEHSNKSLSQVEQSVYDLEKQFFEETGGDAKRSEIQKEAADRKKEIQRLEEQNKSKQTTPNNGGGSANAPKGDVLVQTDLKGRSNAYIPAPGYMCDRGAVGKIAIKIKVDTGGRVIDAKVDSGRSTSTNGCMISYALEFARKSKFNASSSSPDPQEGYIYYTYVYQ